MAENEFEKTEAPTPRRRQEAREEGNVARSTDLTAACVLLGVILLLHQLGRHVLLGGLKTTVEVMLRGEHAANLTRADDLGPMAAFAGWQLVVFVGPLLVAIAAVALLASVSQVGFLLTLKPLQPRFSKLSPIKGVKNLVGARAVMRLAMSIGKIVIIAAVSIAVIVSDIPQILLLPGMDAIPAFAAAASLVFSLALKLAALLLVLALLDYAFQRWQRERELKMTKQEVKEELKRMEGDPLIKHRRTRVARQLALQRIAHTVPTADVVVTNPTHYAVAMRYESAAMTAPKVVAKGADFLAMRIRQIAIANGVPLVERKDLARALYTTVEVGQEVPPQFYSAVAEILAYVYRLGGRKSA
ncbi:MAG: flagellar biosynthesis protein FlhB [Phycisphaeraceae bacterium]